MASRVLEALFFLSGLVVFFRPYVGPVLSLVCAMTWMPIMLILDSTSLPLSVAALLWAFALRRSPITRARRSLSYTLLILTSIFRSNYLMVVVLFAAYDALRFASRSDFSTVMSVVRPRWRDWPIAALVAGSILFSVNQSDHRWNNAAYSELTWYGTNSGSLSTAVFLGALVQWVIVYKYKGDFENHDLYFVAREEFGEINPFFDLFSRPDLILGNLYNNKQILHTLTMQTDIGKILVAGATKLGSHKFAYPVFFILLLAGIGLFCRNEGNKDETRHVIEIFVIVVLVTLPVILLAPPTGRHTYHWLPVFAFAGLGYGRWLFESSAFLKNTIPRWAGGTRTVLLLLPVVMFSNGISIAALVMGRAFDPAEWQGPNLVNEVFGGRFGELSRLLSGCRGFMMVDETTFMATFAAAPVENFHTLYEIPPFGRYGDGGYDGLRPDRIDCIIISYELVRSGLTTFTTRRSRYLNYLVPYMKKLKSMGAKTYGFDIVGGLDVFVLR